MPYYRLQVLLEMRQRAEEEAQKRLDEEKAKLCSAKAALQRFEVMKDQMIHKRHTSQGESTQNLQFQDQAQLPDPQAQNIAELTHSIEKQYQATKVQDADVQRAQKALAQRSRELRVIEKHRDAWLRAWKTEQSRSLSSDKRGPGPPEPPDTPSAAAVVV